MAWSSSISPKSSCARRLCVVVASNRKEPFGIVQAPHADVKFRELVPHFVRVEAGLDPQRDRFKQIPLRLLPVSIGLLDDRKPHAGDLTVPADFRDRGRSRRLARRLVEPPGSPPYKRNVPRIRHALLTQSRSPIDSQVLRASS